MAQSWLDRAIVLNGLPLTVRAEAVTVSCLTPTKLGCRIGRQRCKVLLLSARVSILSITSGVVITLFGKDAFSGFMKGK